MCTTKMPIPYSEEPNVTAVTTPTVSWAVSATHNFINQAITDTTSLVTAGLSTPGSENYVEDFLTTDYDITLPQIGTTSHFVSPNQPIFIMCNYIVCCDECDDVSLNLCEWGWGGKEDKAGPSRLDSARPPTPRCFCSSTWGLGNGVCKGLPRHRQSRR